MNKTFTQITAITGLLISSFTFGQTLEKYETVYYQDAQSQDLSGDNINVTLDIKNIVAQKDNAKFALKVSNNGEDFIMFIPKESTFKYASGEMHPDEKTIIIEPTKNKSKTINVVGGQELRVENFEYVAGGFYRIPVDGAVAEAEDFQLPAAKNNFTAGNFNVVLKSYKATTAEAKAQFEVTYKGKDIAIVNPANLSVRAKKNKSEETVMYANDEKKSDPEILMPGDKMKFNATFHIEGRIVDMQFATMHIIWNNTFTETKSEPIEAVTFPMNWDPGVTEGKK